MNNSAFLKHYLALFGAGLFLVGCGPAAADYGAEGEVIEPIEYPEARDLGEGLTNTIEALGEAIQGEIASDPVDFRELQELLPRRIKGMERIHHGGDRKGVLGIRISRADQEYRGTRSTVKLEIHLIDLGSLRNAAVLGYNTLQLEIDSEDENGFERTRQYKGHPALEKCEISEWVNQCSLYVFVAERFIVHLESEGWEMRRLYDVMGDIKIRKLEQYKKSESP